jgi:hypothetical protein
VFVHECQAIKFTKSGMSYPRFRIGYLGIGIRYMHTYRAGKSASKPGLSKLPHLSNKSPEQIAIVAVHLDHPGSRCPFSIRCISRIGLLFTPHAVSV